MEENDGIDDLPHNHVMINITVDVAGAIARLQDYKVQELPFVTSKAINSAAYESRLGLLAHIQSIYRFRTGSATHGGAFGKGWFAVFPSRKDNLVAEVKTDPKYTYEHLYRDSGTGGIKIARKHYLCVPLGSLRERLIPADLRPRAILASGFGIIVGMEGHQFIAVRSTKTFKSGSGIVTTNPRYKGLQFLYVLVPMVRIRAQKVLNMEQEVRAIVAKVFPQAFEREMALRTTR